MVLRCFLKLFWRIDFKLVSLFCNLSRIWSWNKRLIPVKKNCNNSISLVHVHIFSWCYSIFLACRCLIEGRENTFKVFEDIMDFTIPSYYMLWCSRNNRNWCELTQLRHCHANTKWPFRRKLLNSTKLGQCSTRT